MECIAHWLLVKVQIQQKNIAQLAPISVKNALSIINQVQEVVSIGKNMQMNVVSPESNNCASTISKSKVTQHIQATLILPTSIIGHSLI